MAVALPDTRAGLKCLGVPAPWEMITVPPYDGSSRVWLGVSVAVAVDGVCMSGAEQFAVLAATSILSSKVVVIALFIAFFPCEPSLLRSNACVTFSSTAVARWTHIGYHR